MHLILWRHADAEDAAPGRPDAERELTPKGARQAQAMAQWLEKRLPRGFHVIASPARRTRQTAGALTERFVTRPEVAAEDPAALLRAAGWPGGAGAVVVVGHQPTLGQAAALALTGRAAGWTVRKGAVWWLESREDGEIGVRAVIDPGTL